MNKPTPRNAKKIMPDVDVEENGVEESVSKTKEKPVTERGEKPIPKGQLPTDPRLIGNPLTGRRQKRKPLRRRCRIKRGWTSQS